MLAKLVEKDEQIVLIEETGIQFLDFGFGQDPKRMREANFVDEDVELQQGTLRAPAFLVDEESGLRYRHGEKKPFRGTVPYSAGAEDTLRILDGQWLPVPFYRWSKDGSYELGPGNWVRCRVDRLDEPDEDGNHYRVTLAVDTSVSESTQDHRYLAPTGADVERGEVFGLVERYESIVSYAFEDWVNHWVEGAWRSNLRDRQGRQLTDESIKERLEEWPLEPVSRYLHFLVLLQDELDLPKLKLLENRQDRPKVESTLIIDIGNSRTCAIVLEKHPDQNRSLRQSYKLNLRDLGCPYVVYDDPFESRVEFSAADFGSKKFSRESGRNNAFMWPTLVRIGPEAGRLAANRRGDEGATGIASPKRYLWDRKSFPLDWRFNQPNSIDIEPVANEGVMVSFINEAGNILSDIDEDESDMPVLSPRYSRSSLTTFLITEILAQALVQINSVSQRESMANSGLPRNLVQLVVTLPPAMPIQEREILKKRTRHAVTLLWQALGYPVKGGDEQESESVPGSPPVPQITVEFDEATCAQVVWLYSAIVDQFGGRAQDMFSVYRRPFGDAEIRPENQLRVASIDIGGGTSDLVISDFSIEGSGNNVTIVPKQIFREGFNVAGDDILKRVIQVHVIEPIERRMAECGVSDPRRVTRELFGVDRAQDIKIKTVKRLATTQLLAPLGYHLLGHCEGGDASLSHAPKVFTISELLGRELSHQVASYVNDAARDQGAEDFDINAVSLTVDTVSIFKTLETGTEINRVLEPLSELVYVHNCDLLLLTGRPSRLKPVVSIIKRTLAMPVDRILEMGDMRTGSWYPFNRDGRIGDPKTTAAVGAMLCLISEPNFNFRSSELGLSSTTRYLGNITDGVIASEKDIYYSDIDLENEDYQLPENEFEFWGPLNLGVKQLAIARWRAQMLYYIDYADDDARKRYEKKLPLRVVLARDSKKSNEGFILSEGFKIDRVSDNEGMDVQKSRLRIELQTLPDRGGDYWLDSGHVKEM